jgi:hypothetical protein
VHRGRIGQIQCQPFDCARRLGWTACNSEHAPPRLLRKMLGKAPADHTGGAGYEGY